MPGKPVLLFVAITMVLALFAITPGMASAWGDCGNSYYGCGYNYNHNYNYGYTGCGYNYGCYGYPQNYYTYGNYGYQYNHGYRYTYNYNYGYRNSYYGYGQGYNSYRVQWGDTLSRIAARYGVSVGYLQRLNGISNPNYIWAGQLLRVR
jgi:hypothetical protein